MAKGQTSGNVSDGEWETVTPAKAAKSNDGWETVSGPKAEAAKAEAEPEKQGQVSQYFGTLGQDILNIPGAAVGAIGTALTQSPITSAKQVAHAVVDPQIDQFKQAGEAYKQGNYGLAATRGLAGALPFLGPAAATIGEEGAQGDYGKAAAHLTELAAPYALGKGASLAGKAAGKAGSSAVGKLARNVNNPAEEAALRSVEKDVPMNLGQRTGQHGLQRAAAGLQNFPGSAHQAEEAARATEAGLTAKGNQLISKASPTKTNPLGAGQAIESRLDERITRLKGQADKLYGEVRSKTAANQKTVQTGVKESKIVDEHGKPFQTPIMRTFETPVDLAPVKAAVEPIYSDLMRAMPEARRASSPAFRALEELVNSKETQMNAMDFDKTLSAVKSLARDGKNPYLTDKSQGIAKQIIKHGETEMQKALQGAGADVPTKLKSARTLVKNYYDTADLKADLFSDKPEPAATYSHLVSGGDKVYNTLKDLNRIAPKQVRVVGRTYLEGMFGKATAEGGFGRAAGVMADWQRMGPETKELLFGKPLTGELDNFFLAAKRLTSPVNASGTAHTIAAMGAYGAAGRAMLELFGGVMAGHPGVGVLAAGAEVGRSYVVPKMMARVLLTPSGAKLMTNAIKQPTRSASWAKTMSLLNARMISESNRASGRGVVEPTAIPSTASSNSPMGSEFIPAASAASGIPESDPQIQTANISSNTDEEDAQ